MKYAVSATPVSKTLYFKDRTQAGRMLARALKDYDQYDSVVMALPRGGVVLGYEVAKKLHAPLGLVLVRKIGHPLNPEFAIGAVAEDEEPVFSAAIGEDISETWLTLAKQEAQQLIEHRRTVYYPLEYVPLRLKDKAVILVDDGIATGLTMEASIKAVKKQMPELIVVAVPAAPIEAVQKLKTLVDEVFVLIDPNRFLGSVGAHYRDFEPVSDYSVRQLMDEANSSIL